MDKNKPTLNEYELFHSSNLYLPSRSIYFGGNSSVEDEGDEVTPRTVSQLIKNLHILEHREIAPISVLLMTCGGSWEAGIAVYDIIKSLRSQVTILGLGEVYSMGSIILQAADKRVVTKHTKIMVHDPSGGYFGHSKAFEEWAEDSKVTRKQMYNIYYKKLKAKNKKITLKDIENNYLTDKVYSAEEAVKIGLADTILGDKK